MRAVIDFSMELGKVICVPDAEEAAERDASMAAARPEGDPQTPPPLPGITNGIVRPGDPLAGQLFVQGRVDDGGGPVLLDDLVGAGWRMVTMDPEVASAVPDEVLAWFVDCGGAVVTVAEGEDIDGTYAAWFERHDVAAVLQRPDFYLFGSASRAGQAGELIYALRHRARPARVDAAAEPRPRTEQP